MKTFNQFITEAYAILDEDAASYERKQANKKARGREGKTPKYIEKSVGRVEKTPEGKWEVKKSTEKRINPKASVGMFKAGRHGAGPGIQGGGHGGKEMGYVPAQHSTGGINRGKKKGEQTKAPEPKLNKFQRKAAVARAKHYRTGGSTMQSGMVGDRAAERIREKARKSFGAWSKDKGQS